MGASSEKLDLAWLTVNLKISPSSQILIDKGKKVPKYRWSVVYPQQFVALYINGQRQLDRSQVISTYPLPLSSAMTIMILVHRLADDNAMLLQAVLMAPRAKGFAELSCFSPTSSLLQSLSQLFCLLLPYSIKMNSNISEVISGGSQCVMGSWLVHLGSHGAYLYRHILGCPRSCQHPCFEVDQLPAWEAR